MTDAFGNKAIIPTIGTKVLRDGYSFTVTKVEPIDDVYMIASIEMKGEAGYVEIGYYDFITYENA